MLKKLLKHEWKSVSGFLSLMNGLLVLVTLMGILFSRIGSGLDLPAQLSSLFLPFYALITLALVISCFIYLISRFQLLFTNQGYLLHTLPVKSWQLLFSKILIFFAWVMITLFICALSLIFLDWSIKGFSGNPIPDFGINSHPESMLAFLCTAALILFGVFLHILMVCCAMTLGSLFRKHRNLFTAVFFVGFYLLYQVIVTLTMMFTTPLEFSSPNGTYAVFLTFSSGMLILTALLCVVYYVVIERILKNHLNLE